MTITLDSPVTVPDSVLDGFLSVPPPTIGHVRQTGFMDTEIKPLYRLGKVVVGRAVTLKMMPGDATLTRPAIAALGAGDILVIDCAANRQIAAWGEMTSLAAKVRGAVGVIIDGLATDVLEISEMEMPTFARGLSALVGRRLGHEGGVNVPVQCGGVLVMPGDVVVADDNGIVVIPAAEAEDVYLKARAFEDRSPHQRRWLLGGGPLEELTGLDAEQIAAKNAERGF
jgi:4-hydroxy-4-methyl-2-oxoglutarate aldolase